MDVIAMLRERVKGTFPDLLGIEFADVSSESVRATLTVRPDLCTAGEILHGGAIMAFADTLGAVATVMNLSPSGRTATIESKTNFFSPALAGAVVTGECAPLHRGKQTMAWQTKVTTAEGKLVAIVIQTQMILEA